jgi:hypothetical protein
MLFKLVPPDLPFLVLPGLGQGNHAVPRCQRFECGTTWIAGSSPAMTMMYAGAVWHGLSVPLW